jgi:hypothetical protein
MNKQKRGKIFERERAAIQISTEKKETTALIPRHTIPSSNAHARSKNVRTDHETLCILGNFDGRVGGLGTKGLKDSE